MIRTRTVLDKRKINFPDEIGEVVVFERPEGECVNWYFDVNSSVSVISNAELEEDRYVYMDWTQVSGKNIRPPNRLVENLNRPIYKGQTVVYLAHSEMMGGEKRSVYLLTESQALDLLDSDEGERGLKEALMHTPAFLPIPK